MSSWPPIFKTGALAALALAATMPTQQEIADIRRHLKRPSVTDPAKKAARKRQRKARAIRRRHAA